MKRSADIMTGVQPAAGAALKTPKQLLLELYDIYPTTGKPAFTVMAIPNTATSDPLQFTATVVCPPIESAPGIPAFEELEFQGQGRSKKAAEQDCADRAFAYLRTIPGLRLPSATLVPIAPAAVSTAVAAVPAVVPAASASAAAVPAASQAPAPAGSVGAPLAALTGVPAAPAVAPLQYQLAINDAMIDSMPEEQLRTALREVLGHYKALVQAVHSESQRHTEELHSAISRQL